MKGKLIFFHNELKTSSKWCSGANFAVLALLVTEAHASYSWSYSFSLADNTPYCATINCLTSLGGNVTEIKAGIDGTIYGLNSNHVLYAYTEASGWVESAATLQTAGGQAILHISVGSASKVIAQTAITGANIYVLNSAGTAWSSLSGGGICTDTEISADGDLWCIDMSGTVPFHYIKGGLDRDKWKVRDQHCR